MILRPTHGYAFIEVDDDLHTAALAELHQTATVAAVVDDVPATHRLLYQILATCSVAEGRDDFAHPALEPYKGKEALKTVEATA